MRTVVCTLLLPFCLALSATTRADPVVELSERLQHLGSLAGAFQQTLYSVDGEPLEQSSGRFSLLRPGYLRWHILAPDEQLLVASGETLWHYDVELETATRRRIPAGNPTSPLTILGGDVDLLASYYAVERPAPDRWRLSPNFDGAEFTRVDLFFDGELPARMNILDTLGRESRIALSDLVADTGLEPGDFQFQPPPGVDVYTDEP